METIRPLVAAVPLAPCLLGSGLIALSAQTWLLRLAMRRRARQRNLRIAAENGSWDAVGAAAVPGAYPEILALFALLLIPLAAFAGVERARAMVAASWNEADPAAAMSLLARGWKGQLATISLGIVIEELAGGLGVVAWSFAFASRRQIAGLVHAARIARLDRRDAAAWARHPFPPAETVLACAGSVAALVLLPTMQGAFAFCSLLYRKIAAADPAAPGGTLNLIGLVLPDARRALDSGIVASGLGVVLAALTCGGLLWWRSPARLRQRWLGRREVAAPVMATSALDALWFGVVVVLVVLTLFVVSRPLPARQAMSGWPRGAVTAAQ
jgi:hypothetical protein